MSISIYPHFHEFTHKWFINMKKLNISPLQIIILYMLISFIARIIDINEFALSFLSLPSFIIFPYIIGEILMLLPQYSKKMSMVDDTDFIVRLTLLWFAGAITITVIGMLLQTFKLYFLIKHMHIFIIILNFIFILYLVNRVQHPLNRKYNPFSKNVAVYLLIVAIGMLPIIIAHREIPFPMLGYNYAMPRVLSQPAIRMIENGYIFMSNPGRFPGLIILTAIASASFGINPLSFMWSAQYLLYFIFSVGIFIFVYDVSKNKWFSIFVVYISVFIMTGGKSYFYDTPANAFRSNTLLWAMFPYMLYTINRYMSRGFLDQKNLVKTLFYTAIFSLTIFLISISPFISNLDVVYRNYAFIAILIVSAILILMTNVSYFENTYSKMFLILSIFMVGTSIFHLFEAVLFLFSIALYLILCHLKKVSKLKIISVIILFLIFAQMAGFITLENNIFTGLVFGDTHSKTAPDFSDKYDEFMRSTNIHAIYFLILGMLFALISCRKVDLIMVTMSCCLLFIIFMPESFSGRIFKESIPFAGYLVALPLLNLSKNLNKNKKIMYIFLIIVVLTPALIQPISDRYALPDGQSYFLMTDYEYGAIEWIKGNTDENARIISDYQTIQMFNSMADRISITEKFMNINKLNESQLNQFYHIKENIFLAENSEDAYEAILQLKGSEQDNDIEYLSSMGKLNQDDVYFIIVVSSKTSQWIRKPGIAPIFQPVESNVNSLDLEIFNNSKLFDLSYQVDDEIYIYIMK